MRNDSFRRRKQSKLKPTARPKTFLQKVGSEGRTLVRQTLEGYRRMNELTEQELMQRLPKMTEQQAREEFEELWEVWEHTRKHYPDPKGDATMDRLHLEFLVERRRKFDKIARGWTRRS